jgi:fumarylacetoacetase
MTGSGKGAPSAIDATHAKDLASWVASANGHSEFPIQNLPFGVFRPAGQAARGGVAIGNEILDLAALSDSPLVPEALRAIVSAAAQPQLNALLAMPAQARRDLRHALSGLLREGAAEAERVRPLLHRAAACQLELPARIPAYTDFYAGIHHAMNIGSLMRPDNPLLPNYRYVPIGYNGRASSVRASGTDIVRPNGQRKRPDEAAPSFGPCRNLDYELELGIWIGQGNELGEPIGIDHAEAHVAGLCLLNDWSARDIQAWEYQPLGPFLSKGFGTTISPWLVTMEALAPFRSPPAPRGEGEPAPLDYLSGVQDRAQGGFEIALEVLLVTERMRAEGAAPHRLSSGTTQDLYWTIGQLVTHHSSNGCNLEPGDLFGSGTISGKEPGSFGSLMEISRGGRETLQLPNGETRTFLVDGDEIIMKARAQREGFASIGFGECRARILPART